MQQPRYNVQPNPDKMPPPPENRQRQPGTSPQYPENQQQPSYNVQQYQDTLQQPSYNVQQYPNNMQQYPDTVQQQPEYLQQQPYNVQPHPDTVQLYSDDMEHIEDMQQIADNLQPPPDTMQQQPDDMDSREDIELAQNRNPSIQWSDSVDSEEKTRRQFVIKVVMDVIKLSQLKDAGDPVMVSYTKRLVIEILKGLQEDSFKDVCSKSVSKAVYSQLHSKFGENLKYMLLLPDPGVIASVVKCFQSEILEKIAKPCRCMCSRECILNVLSGFIGLTSLAASVPFVILFVGALIL